MSSISGGAGNWLRRTPIRAALIAAFILVSGAPLLLVWQWSHAIVLKQQVDEVRERHLLIARNLGAALQRYHRDVVSIFGSFAPLVAAGKNPEFAGKLFQDLHFRHVCVFHAETGESLSEAFINPAPCPAAIPPNRVGMFREMTSTGEVALSPVSLTPDGETVIYVGQRIGERLVVGAIRTVYFRTLAKQISFGGRGHAAIVDHTGKVLAHPLPAWEAEAKDISAISAVRRMLAGESGVEQFYSPALKGDMIAGFTAIEGPGWGVMVPQPVSELQDTAARISKSALYVLGLAMAGALAIALILSHWIARPVNRVARVALGMAEGETGARLDESDLRLALRETGDLGVAFNTMAERIEAAQEKETELRIRAETAANAKSEFLANMSHEIRTPLNGVLGIAEVLRTTELNDRQAMFVDKIRESGAGLLAVLNDVLDVAKIEAGRATPANRSFDVAETMDSVAALMRPQAEARGIMMETEIASGLDTKAVGDEQRIRQVLLNLTGNALKFAEDGNIVIHAEGLLGGRKEEMIKISVIDTGIGIDPKHHDEIFEKFAQVDGAHALGQNGTGLGLSIAKSFVEGLGGKIGVNSTPGEGSTFWFTFPKSATDHTEPTGSASTLG